MDDLLLHPKTRKHIALFLKNPTHGLILVGQTGSGKKTIAQAITAELVGRDLQTVTDYPYFTVINPDAQSITIEEIRNLQKLLTLKTPKTTNNPIQRVLCIIDAGRMRQEAQNAFLKSLEEPPIDTCIILTTETGNDLLETLYSRAQRIDILPVSEAMAREYYASRGLASQEITKNYALSQGQVGLLHSLLQKDVEHPLKQWVQTAKDILAKSPGERLLLTDELSKDKTGITLLLNALGRIAHAALTAASKQGNEKAITRWRNSLASIESARDSYVYNANTKLLLDELFLNL